jgi:hypothetical protein
MFINQSFMTQTTSAYSFGDCIGSLATLAGAELQAPSSWKLDSILFKDRKRSGVSAEALFFDQMPAHTAFTDNQPLEIDERDSDKLCYVASIPAANWENVSTQALQFIDLHDAPIEGRPDLHVALRALGSVTFASQSCLTMGIAISR